MRVTLKRGGDGDHLNVVWDDTHPAVPQTLEKKLRPKAPLRPPGFETKVIAQQGSLERLRQLEQNLGQVAPSA